MSIRIRQMVLAALMLLLTLSNALAHNTSVTYLDLSDKQLAQGLWSLKVMMPIEELDLNFGLDIDRNSELSRSELDQKIPVILGYVTNRIGLSTERESFSGKCAPSVVNHHIDQHADAQTPAVFLTLRLQFNCAADARTLHLNYDLFREFDAAHRALLSYSGRQQVVVPGEPQSLQVTGNGLFTAKENAKNDSIGNAWTAFPGYVRSGFHHILIGWDHLAFLIALLIPLIVAQAGFTKRQVKYLLVTVTVFTLGHSLSLAAVTLGWLSVPTRLVEVVIAASIVVAAAFCLFRRDFIAGPVLAGGFGLVHGFGFANVLEVGDANGSTLWVSLLGFNLGVETGQLLFIALALPTLAMAARFSVSRRLVSQALPVALIFAGLGWFTERLINIDLIPG